ncbi:MAG: SET domain-containing protein-lysine N-methyltransferase [Bryobacteraceae bacterium]|nr:SET domain-containing protein-lysine N-methyltransferase [Bryobacteraceae bacterium]MCX7603598.1 SET domain-containing protein-lysine N-methyltransferase [Bryobacteraceae bacterium]
MPNRSNSRKSVPEISEKHACFRLSIRPSRIHRWGVFAEEFIPKGRKIIEYTGEKISRVETARRARSRRYNYLFTLDSYWTIDGSVGGSGAEYINHCCEPNCVARIVRGHILYFAARDIQPGEELTVDYRFDPDVEQVQCRCGAPNCRGTINLRKERRRTAARRKTPGKRAAPRKAAPRSAGNG